MSLPKAIDIPAKPLRKKSIQSAMQILRIPALRNRVLPGPVEWNEMLQCPTIDRVPVEDHHVTQLRERIELHLTDAKGNPLEFAADTVHAAIDAVAHENPFHPVREYLDGLPAAPLPRIAEIPSILGIPDPKPIHHDLIRAWLISAVARVYEPGCKADGVLILQGAQGAGKSSFFAVLGGEWFSDSPIDPGSKDAALACSRAWIIEMAELAAISKRDLETVKAFITSRQDDFRPPYGRRIVSLPRRCVFGGSSNHEEILHDTTGNRRFWIIPTGPEIDLYQLAIWRDQIWAEARDAYRAGEPWHLDYGHQQALAAEQQRFEATDAWTGPILALMKMRLTGEPPTMAEILEEAVEKPRGQITRADQLRAAGILAKAGYIRRRVDGTGGRQWRWGRPEQFG